MVGGTNGCEGVNTVILLSVVHLSKFRSLTVVAMAEIAELVEEVRRLRKWFFCSRTSPPIINNQQIN